MSEMAERVALRLRAHEAIGVAIHAEIIDDDNLRDFARAAIEAMREPTKAMENAAYKLTDDTDRWACHPDDSWRAMIDEALK